MLALVYLGPCINVQLGAADAMGRHLSIYDARV